MTSHAVVLVISLFVRPVDPSLETPYLIKEGFQDIIQCSDQDLECMKRIQDLGLDECHKKLRKMGVDENTQYGSYRYSCMIVNFD